MTFKTKITALALLAACLTLSLCLGTFYSYRGAESRAARPLSSFLRTGTVNELVFINGGVSARLVSGASAENAGGDFSVIIAEKPFPAARNKTERFFELFDAALVSPAVTENPENWPRFGLDEAAAKRVRFTGTAGETEMLLGNEEQAGRGQYIRFAESPAVYIVSQSFSYYAERDSAYWSDLRVFPASLSARDIIALSASGAFSWSLYRERTPEGVVWTAEGQPDAKPEQGKADSLAASLSQLNAKAFAPDTEAAGADLNPPETVLTLTASNQTQYELRISRADETGNRYCASSLNGTPSPFVYILDAGAAEKILVPFESLLEPVSE